MIELKHYKNFASKDTTRAHLEYGHVFDGVLKITDGHRMLAVDTSYPDGAYDVKTMQRLADEMPATCVKALCVETSDKLVLAIDVPSMLGALRDNKTARLSTIYLDKKGVFHFVKPDDFLAAFNPLFFREVAGQTIEAYHDKHLPEISPLIIKGSSESGQSVLIMPKRA